MRKSRIACILFACLSFFPAYSQNIIHLGITKTDVSQFELKQNILADLLMVDLTTPNALYTISDKLVTAYTNDPGFKVIDFRSYALVKEERERQKSEDFIDGYIIEQGKSEGADFILSPIFLAVDNEIAIRLFDVETGRLHCSASTPLVKNKTGAEYTRYYTAILIDQLNNRCFNIQYPVIRSLKDKGNESKELLIAFGRAQQAKEKNMVGIYITKTEMVNGQELDRQLLIGEGEIVTVEDDNFSIVSVRKGGDDIKQQLDQGNSLFVRLLKIDK